MSADLTDEDLRQAELACDGNPQTVVGKLLRAYESLAAELANARGPEPFAESAAAGLGPLLESERTAHEQTKALLENALANCLHAQRERDTARELELELADELHSMCDRVLAVDSALATALKLLQRWKNKRQRDARSSSTGLLWADTAAYLSSHPTPVADPLGPKHCGFCQRAPCECHYEPVAAPCADPHGVTLYAGRAAPCAGCAELHKKLEAEEMRGLLETRAFFEEIPKRYRPISTEQRLGYLVEECGEVLAAAGKSQRWGLASVNPELPEDERETNAAWLLRELRDLKRAIGLVENDGEVHEVAALRAARSKP